MVVFGIEIKDDEVSKAFVKDTQRRLKVKSLAENPFRDSRLVIIDKPPLNKIILFNLKPIYPNPKMLFWFFLIVVILFRGINFSWWFLLPCIFLIGCSFHTRHFFYIMMKLGLKKSGYKEKTRLMAGAELWEEVIIAWHKEKS